MRTQVEFRSLQLPAETGEEQQDILEADPEIHDIVWTEA